MADAKRDATAKRSPAAMRGRISERAWVDIRRAARIASTAGVTLRVHGVEVSGTALMQRRMRTKMQCTNDVQSKVPAASVAAPATRMEVCGEAPTPPLSKRQQRSAARLLEFQEKRRDAEVQRTVARGGDLVYAHEKQQRAERRRLELIDRKRHETRGGHGPIRPGCVQQPCARVEAGGERPSFCLGLTGRPCQCVRGAPATAWAPEAG